jgi:hypothetical protein
MPHSASQEDQRKAVAAPFGFSSPARRSKRATVSTFLAARKQTRIIMAPTARHTCTGDGQTAASGRNVPAPAAVPGSSPRQQYRRSPPRGERHRAAGSRGLFVGGRADPVGQDRSPGEPAKYDHRTLLALLAERNLDDFHGDEGDGGNEIGTQHDHPDPLAEAQRRRWQRVEPRHPPGRPQRAQPMRLDPSAD